MAHRHQVDQSHLSLATAKLHVDKLELFKNDLVATMWVEVVMLNT